MTFAKKLTVASLIAFSLVGCSAQFDDLQAEMDAIRQKPRGKVDAPPEFNPMPTFTYAAHQLRSPFAPPISQDLIDLSAGKQVEPDLNRPQEYLERFNVESLRLRGTLQRPGATLYALIEDGEGGVQRVKVGNYLGKNHGRILEITPSQVSFVEIVPDGRDGWVERPRSLALNDN